MPKTIYDPTEGRKLGNLNVLTVKQPVRRKARILDGLLKGSNVNYDHGNLYGYSRGSFGLYECQFDDGAYGTGAVGYLHMTSPKVAELTQFLSPVKKTVIKAGMTSGATTKAAHNVTAALLGTALQDYSPSQTITLHSSIELPIREVTGVEEDYFTVDAVMAELVRRYPWLEKAMIENSPTK